MKIDMGVGLKGTPFKLSGSSTGEQIRKVLMTDFSPLLTERFATQDGVLRIKCGIGPEDPAAERNCYEFMLHSYRHRIRSLREDLAEWQQYTIGNFIMDKCPPVGSKQSKSQFSSKMVDGNGVVWQLLVLINAKGGKGFVGTFLTKCTPGHEGWYEYFIELVNPHPEQQNRIVKGSYQYDRYPRLALPQFMTTAFLDQFLVDGTLRFRFGVKLEE